MGLVVDFDSNGYRQIEFPDLRERVLREGRRFNAYDLMHIPYEQLPMCATANAGGAGCDLHLIRTEKRARRQRYAEMSFDEFPHSVRYLQSQSMFPDVLRDRARREAPCWDDLAVMQKAWFKVTCLHNHIDGPGDRLRDIENLLFRAGDAGLIPIHKASVLVDGIAQLIAHYPQKIDAESFRAHIGGQAEELMQMMAEDERDLCAHEILRDYCCTSDCFQPILSGVIS